MTVVRDEAAFLWRTPAGVVTDAALADMPDRFAAEVLLEALRLEIVEQSAEDER